MSVLSFMNHISDFQILPGVFQNLQLTLKGIFHKFRDNLNYL